MTFQSFPRETLTFLRDLRGNNNKVWFHGHAADYQAYYVAPAKASVVAAGAPLKSFAPQINAEHRIPGSIFRVNRDIRFSKDKTPYKDHLDFWFWEGERKRAVSGFFVRVTADYVGIGAGCHGFDSDRLRGFRAAVADAPAGTALAKTAAKLKGAGYAIGGEHYKRQPKGVEAPPAAALFLLHRALFVHTDAPAAVATTDGAMLETCVGHWRTLAPLHRWLIDNVQNA